MYVGERAPAMADVGITEYLQGRNVLLTGATGFLGKVLLEKLLRACPAIGTIYILVRPKRGKMPQERLKQILQDSLYDRLKKEQLNLNFEQKIIPLSGDCEELNLGLSTEDRRLVTQNVHLIFHSAATVRFDEQLQRAVLVNLRGTREVCHLALECNQIEAFIHVSTAFANCDRDEAEDVLYPAASDWRQAIDVAEQFSPEALSALTAKYVGDFPNTYCFSKNLAEHVVNDLLKGKVPTKIVRPSIVISTFSEEPVHGWIDNINGPVAIFLAYGTGIMCTMYASKHYKPDYIPVDICVKAMVVAAWELAVRQERVVEVMHCTSYQIEWLRPSNQDLMDRIKWIKQYPYNQTVWYPTPHMSTNRIEVYIRMMFCMVLPSALMDAALILTGYKPRFLKIQRKIFVAVQGLRYFLNNEWKYSNSALLALLKCIPEKDRLAWDYDFREGDVDLYSQRVQIGIRRYLLHESDDTLPQARKRLRILYWLYIGWQFVFYIGLLFVLWAMLPAAVTRVLL